MLNFYLCTFYTVLNFFCTQVISIIIHITSRQLSTIVPSMMRRHWLGDRNGI